MAYEHDMRGESNKTLIDEGWHNFEVVSAEEKTSKAGNLMFKINLALADDPTVGCEVYAVAEKGKRWLLKQLLAACGIEANEEGVFSWDIPDIEGKTVQGRIEHKTETWIDREGSEHIAPKAKLMEFKRMEV